MGRQSDALVEELKRVLSAEPQLVQAVAPPYEKLPLAQTEQTVAPLKAENVPALQALQAVPGPTLTPTLLTTVVPYVPWRHRDRQLLSLREPSLSMVVFAGHLVHAVLPDMFAYVPRLQFTHMPAPCCDA